MLTGIDIGIQHLDVARLHFLQARKLNEIGRLIWDASKRRTQQQHCGVDINNTYRPLPPYSRQYAKKKGTTRPDLTLSGAMWNLGSLKQKIARMSRAIELEVYFGGNGAVPRYTAEQIKELQAYASTVGKKQVEKTLSAKWSPAGKAGVYVRKHAGFYLLGVTAGDINKIKVIAENSMQAEIKSNPVLKTQVTI